jgi:hypothetical protein
MARYLICPGEITGFFRRLRRAGWQTDCHTSVLHNFVDAFAALPSWATAADFLPASTTAVADAVANRRESR